MQTNLKLIELLVPDVIETVQERFFLLRNIYWMQPIGRRALAEKLGLTERVLRSEVTYLKENRLIDVTKSGMFLTEKGNQLYENLKDVMDDLLQFGKLEKQLATFFSCEKVIVVAGDAEQQPKVFQEFGKRVSEQLDEQLPSGDNILAVMGGTTMAKVAENVENLERLERHNLFVPARGGIGEKVSSQANSVASMLALKSNGNYRALYVPEKVSSQTYELLIQEPEIQEVLTLIKQSNAVVHSIGRALYMAARRKMSEEILLMLKQKKAVAESFGFFFDEEGQIVYKMPRIGLQLEQLEKIPIIVSVAGGAKKAKAVRAYMKNAPSQTCLVIDEACANEILKGFAPLK